MRRARRRVSEVLLWCGAGLGTLSILAAMLAVSFGIVPLVFTSGSMSPEIPTGSLGLARTVAASDLRVGDVVSVTAASKTRVTHRVVATEEQADTVVLTLQGDANASPDQELYPVTEADRVFVTAPHLGRVVAFLTSPWAMFAGGLAAAALLFWAFRRPPPRGGTGATTDVDAALPGTTPDASETIHTTNARRRIGAMLLAVSLPALLLITSNASTAALFTDKATVGTTGFGTHRVLQPGEASCSASGSTIIVRAVALSDQRYTYWARAYNDAGTAVSGYKQMTGTPMAAQFSTPGFVPPLAAGVTYTFRIYSRIGAPPSGWESELFRRARFSQAGTTLACGEAVVPPVITFTQPLNGFNGTKEQLQALLDRDCGGHGSTNPSVCGTATDPNGTVASVAYILQRSGLGTYCWNEDRYPAFGSCEYRPAARIGDKWSIPGSVYPGIIGWNYTLTVKATDDLGAVTERSISFRVSP